MSEENEKKTIGTPQATPEGPQIDELELPARPGWREIFRQAFDKARREQQVTNRRDLGRDRSRSLFLLAGAAVALLLLFLGVFSSNTARKSREGRRPGTPDLGRRVTPGQQAGGQRGSVTPLLNAQTGGPDSQGNQSVTPEDVGRTARPTRPSAEVPPRSVARPPAASGTGPYALGKIDFTDTAPREPAPEPAPSSSRSERDDLRKASLVFVRTVSSNAPASGAKAASAALEEVPFLVDLPAGTRLVARLESVVNSAIKTPVVAAIEYNYERDGQIVVPAGAKAIGSLQQADRSGYVAIRFDTIEMPDGTSERIDAGAMSLAYGPLKGVVSGKRTGTNFLVRTFTGLGQAATYLVGSGGLSAPLSESAFLRDRIATNIGIAGDQELNSLAFNQNIVVTVPGNTRFYLVVEKETRNGERDLRPAASRQASYAALPSAEELRQLLQLRRELSDMYQQAGTQSTVQEAPQQ
jgi:hypothetical protein